MLRHKKIIISVLGVVFIFVLGLITWQMFQELRLETQLELRTISENNLGLQSEMIVAEKNFQNTNVIFPRKIIASESKILMFVGDIMLSRSVGAKMKKENDWQWPFLKIASYLQEADLLFGNLEGPITDRIISKGNMIFGADPMSVEGLKYAGFDILSLANNHIGDQGQGGMKDTIRILSENDISYVGAGDNEDKAYHWITKNIDGTRIAFLAYVEDGFTPISYRAAKDKSGIAFMDVLRMREDVELAKQEVNLVIVSMHSGIEYALRPSSRQMEFARAAIDAGANLIIGHHPHVTQEVEKYKDGYIAYSLGNFVFDQTFSYATMHGLLLKVIIVDNQIKEVKPVEIEISKEYQTDMLTHQTY